MASMAYFHLRKSETGQQDNNGNSRKTWTNEAAQLTHSLKDMLNNNNPFPCLYMQIYLHP